MSTLPPSPGTPIPYEPYDQNSSTLNTLSIFYFILAGLQALASCFFLLYVAFGVFVAVVGIAGSNQGADAAVGAGLGGVFICLGRAAIAFVGAFAYLNYSCGQGLRKRKSLTTCYIAAAIACIGFPLGTILGVFTFITLSKPGVKESFT